MTALWPLRPQPLPGEALSSWLDRLAATYGYERNDLQHELGPDAARPTIDVSIADEFAHALSQRTGVTTEQIKGMTLEGWVPRLISSADETKDEYEGYAHSYSVLLPHGRMRTTVRPSGPWRPWISPRGIAHCRACPVCLDEDAIGYSRLHWQLSWLTSCPKHEQLLRPMIISQRLGVVEMTSSRSVVIPYHIVALDVMTMQALQKGYVDTVSVRIHAGLWLRLLRTLLEELATPGFVSGRVRKLVHRVWVATKLKARRRSLATLPFEHLDDARRFKLMHAAGMAVGMLGSGSLEGFGRDAHILQPHSYPPADPHNRRWLLWNDPVPTALC